MYKLYNNIYTLFSTQLQLNLSSSVCDCECEMCPCLSIRCMCVRVVLCCVYEPRQTDLTKLSPYHVSPRGPLHPLRTMPPPPNPHINIAIATWSHNRAWGLVTNIVGPLLFSPQPNRLLLLLLLRTLSLFLSFFLSLSISVHFPSIKVNTIP